MSQANYKTETEPDIEYVVEKIIDKKIKRGHLQYLVKWAGYPDSENTWEPLPNLKNCFYAIEKYENSVTKKLEEKILNENNFNLNNKTNNKKKKTKDTENPFNESSNNNSNSLNVNNSHLKNFPAKSKNSDIRSFFIKSEENAKSAASSLLNNKRKASSSNASNYNESPLSKNRKEESQIIEENHQYSIKTIKSSCEDEERTHSSNLINKEEINIGGGKGKEKFYKEFFTNKNHHTADSDNDLNEFGSNSEHNSRHGRIGIDTPSRIKSAKIVGRELICLIEWLQLKPEEDLLPSEYSNNIIKIYEPFLLLKFYEEKIKFKKK